MSGTGTADLRDSKVDVKVVLSMLWVAMMFVFAYVDIFGFWRADVINGALAYKIPGAGFAINQTFLALSTLYIVVPSLMVVVSVMAPARPNRITNIVVSLAYLVTVAGATLGESWVYYYIGSIVEVVLLAAIARVAWTWPRDPAPSTTDPAVADAPTRRAGRVR